MFNSPALGRHAAAAVWLAFLLWANVATPLWADDYCRMTQAGPGGALALAWGEYFTWAGRFVVEAITYFVVGAWRRWTIPAFDVANALLFVALVGLVIRLAGRVAGADPWRGRSAGWQFSTWLVVALMLWWLPRAVGEAALWKTGAIVYLWALTGELFVLDRMIGAAAPRWSALIGLAGLAFAVADFLEPLSALTSALLVVLVGWRWRTTRRLPRGLAAVAAAHLAGTLFLLLSPGSAVRAQTAPVATFAERFNSWFGYIGSLFDGYWAAAAAVLLVLCWRGSRPIPRGGSSLPPLWPGRFGDWLFVPVTAAYLLLLLGVPYHLLTPRVSFPATVFIIAQICVFLLRRTNSAVGNDAAAVLATALLLATVAIAGPHLAALARIDRDWSLALANQRAAGQRDASLPVVRVLGRVHLARKERLFMGVEPGATDWKNACYAHAMGFNSITGT